MSYLGRVFGPLQPGLDRPHLGLRQRHPARVLARQGVHRRGLPLPGHPPGVPEDHLQARQQPAAPLPLQSRPAPLDRVVLAVVRRVVHQPDHQPGGVRERHHPLQELGPRARAVRPVVQVHDQPADAPEPALHPVPPPPQPVRPQVARLPRAEEQGQRPGRHHQDAERGPLPGRRRVVVPPLGRRPVTGRPGFSPRGRTPPRPPSPSCRPRFPASRGRPRPPPGRPRRWRRWRRCRPSSSAAGPSAPGPAGSPSG